MAEMAMWAKLAKPEDVEPYMQQNIKDGADYIKLSQSSIRGKPSFSYRYSARKREDDEPEVRSSID